MNTGDLVHEDVIGDPTRIQQVFVNIIGNAVKYTQSGGHISVFLKELPSENREYAQYSFVCEDDGIGMTEEYLDRLFIPFDRAEDEAVRGVQGTGLGMVITRNIVRMMDGDIRVESVYGEGSRFEVLFKLKIQNKDIRSSKELLGVPVLIVDDDPITSENLELILSRVGMVSTSVRSGYDAIAHLQDAKNRDRYQAILLDWKMPDMDGIETAKQLRTIIDNTIPVVLVSSADFSEIEMEARASGVDGFISKPLFRSRVETKLIELLSEKKSEPASNEIDMFEEADYQDKIVLLVEDNELNMEIALEIIGSTGAKVETASNGALALSMFEKSEPHYYDLIFMDIQMPVMDGCQATRAIRELEREDAKTVPIIAMSANAFVEDMKSSQRAGMNEHIPKPINLRQLLAMMEKYLGVRKKEFTSKEAETKQIHPAKYHEALYLTNGSTVISRETEKACVEILEQAGAVGIIAVYERKGYPLYCISDFALRALGYTYDELMQATDGYVYRLVHPDDEKRLSAEFYGACRKHQYRMYDKHKKVLYVTSYSTDVHVLDGSRVRMFSFKVETKDSIKEKLNLVYSRWKTNILESLTKSALYMYEFDVTTGLVGQDIIAEDGTNYTQVLGIHAPCVFDELIQKSLVNNLKCSLVSVDGLQSLNCKNLLAAYESGDTCPEVEFFYTEDQEYHRLTYYMNRDEESGHVMALVVCHDISKLRES